MAVTVTVRDESSPGKVAGTLTLEGIPAAITLRDPRPGPKNLYLPFEQDSRLSEILSKALLLAEDAKIADTKMARRIRRGG